jgi:drug/metabolite transporter (DMT)-like permease
MITAERHAALLGHAAMLTFSAFVAGSFSLGARIANDIDPVTVNGMRFLGAAFLLTLAALVLERKRPGPVQALRSAPWRFPLLGAMFAGYFVLMFEGLKTAEPVTAGAVFTLTPVMTALIAWPMLGQRLDTWTSAALGLGAIGAVWVIFRGDPGALLRFDLGRGEGIYFIGCILHAIFTPMLKRLNRGEGPMVSTSLIMAGGLLVLLAYDRGAAFQTDWAALSGFVWLSIAYLMVFASALSIVLLQFAAQRLPSSKVMAYTYATPAWIILVDAAVGGALPGLAILPGVVLIGAALAMLLRSDEGRSPS